jgi:putative ABC transport system permease protein
MIFMTLRIAMRALGRNKVRSALTMLGVIIGVAALIAMVAIGQGATHMVQKQIESMGQNLLMVLPGATSSGAVSWGVGSQQTLSPKDAEAIARDCPSAAAVGVVIRTRAQMVYGSQNWSPSTVQGCDPGYLEVRQWPTVEGDVFSDQDVKTAAQVCVVGQTIVDNLFNGEDPVGKTVRVKNLPFRVLGILDKKGANTFGSDQDDTLFLPWTTVKKKLQGSSFNTVDQIFVSARSQDAMSPLEEEIKEALRINHRIQVDRKGEYNDDFQVRNMTEMMNAMTATTSIMSLLLALTAAVSLLVGGIGIMNIMLVSVTERTREIGLRMAVGARQADVLSQFLVEAIVLAALGGFVGIVLGGGGAITVARLAHWPALVSPLVIALAVLFSGAIGVIFGFYPAWRASRLDPIDALRYE